VIFPIDTLSSAMKYFSGRKKKLNSYITFPEVLDMTDYLHPTQGSVIFYLVNGTLEGCSL